VYWSAVRERPDAPPDAPLLRTLAAATGGRVLGAGDTAFSAARPPAFRDVRGWLAAAALAIVLVELFWPAALAAVRRRRPAASFDFEDAPGRTGGYGEAA
jgi:hypothetical protein